MKTEKIELAGVIYKHIDGWQKGRFDFYSCYTRADFDENGVVYDEYIGTRLYVCDHTITIEVPVIDDLNLNLKLNALNAQEKELRAQFAARLMEITTQRNNLLALPNEVVDEEN